MSRKVKTTPDQREILWLLADTGKNSLLTILNALYVKFGGVSPDVFVKRIERALGIIERLGFIFLLWQFESETREMRWEESQTLSVDQFFVWDDNASQWTTRVRPNFVDIIVHLTAGGAEALDIIAAQSQEPTPTFKPPQD